MEELVPIIITAKGNRAVDGRLLHEALEVKTNFIDWMKRMIEYGFEQNIDYLKSDCPVNQYNTKHEYILKLDMAKEISMLQRTEKGRQIRKYFIAKELEAIELRTANPPVLPQTYLEALKQLTARVESNQKLLEENAILAPKAQAADVLLLSQDTIKLGEFGKMIGIGQNTLFKKMREDKYLIPTGSQQNLPYQRFINQGLFVVKEVPRETVKGTLLFSQTQITPKGQVYFSNIYSKQLS